MSELQSMLDAALVKSGFPIKEKTWRNCYSAGYLRGAADILLLVSEFANNETVIDKPETQLQRLLRRLMEIHPEHFRVPVAPVIRKTDEIFD